MIVRFSIQTLNDVILKNANEKEFIQAVKEFLSSLDEVVEKDAARAIREAVKGMLPKNKLAADRLARLKVFEGAEHAHAAQNPKEIK